MKKAGKSSAGRGRAPGKTARRAKVSREDRGKRLLDLVVMLLGARHPVPFREIRAQFKAYRTQQEEAGLRAFERDKSDLLELGVPLRYIQPEDDDAIEEAGYVVDLRRYRLPEIRLTPAEVAALVLAGSVARAAPGTTYAEVVDLALKKLAFDAPPVPDTPGAPVGGARRPTEPVIVHFPHPAQAQALAERLAHIEQAVANHKRVTLKYITSSTGQTSVRQVDPYGLIYRAGAWYLVGWCHLKKKVLTFRVDRILEEAVAPKPKSPDFERPADFDVRRYANRSPWTFEIEPPIDVELEIRPEAGAVANEDFGPGAARTELPGGGVKVRFACSNPGFVITRVLEAKGAIVVHTPAPLRARVAAELNSVLRRYA